MAEQNLDRFYKNPYLFNAKELDRETGLYYYGARYYNPKLSMWYGVDPLAEKMPSWSPYAYTFDNPVKFIDPDGRSPDDIVINLFNLTSGKYREYARIKSDKYHFQINVSSPYPFQGISLAPDDSHRRTYGNYRGISGQYKFDEMASVHGDPDAVSLSFGGNVAIGKGFGRSVSVALMLNGADKGKAGLYFTSSNLVGVEATIGIQADFIFSDISMSKFNMETLEGYTDGIQAGAGPLGGSLFKSYDGEYKGNWLTGKTFQKKKLLYHGYSYGLGIGPEDISTSGSIYQSDTTFLGEITNVFKEKDENK